LWRSAHRIRCFASRRHAIMRCIITPAATMVSGRQVLRNRPIASLSSSDGLEQCANGDGCNGKGRNSNRRGQNLTSTYDGDKSIPPPARRSVVVSPIAAVTAICAAFISHVRGRYRQQNSCLRTLVLVAAVLVAFSLLLALLDALFSTVGIASSASPAAAASHPWPTTMSPHLHLPEARL